MVYGDDLNVFTKKIVAPLFFPVTLILGILILGLFLLSLTQRQKTGKIVVLIGIIFLGMCY